MDITLIWNIIFAILFILCACWAMAERDKRIKDKAAWSKGLDELEESYQQEMLSLHEKWEETYNNMRDQMLSALQTSRDAHSMTADELQAAEEKIAILNAEISRLEYRSGDHRDNSDESWDNEELYAIAATELLETVNEIDKITKEVADWGRIGTPFDA